ncbi:OmpA family protein [Polluticoccus soli]|uniref:OmpA family protein n=1 Tax=Polluticoccus soli TaxID=3034150 RepID=UPI0023E0E2A4|nr:OmpA family protein [Flavipsychrobacter sp. JY13-12]
MVKTAFYLGLLILPLRLFAQAKQDTIHVYFDLGVSAIKQTEQLKIDSLVYYDVLQPGKKLGIIGYADYLGSEETNVGLSETRAGNIKTYLLGMGFHESDIEMVIGKGEVKREVENGTAGYREDRRVDIIPGGFKAAPAKALPASGKTIDLTKVKTNETLRLENIYFVGGSHQWSKKSEPALNTLLAALKQHPTVRIRIEGHICCESDQPDGLDIETGKFNLSTMRAKAVRDYLVENGIDVTRLEYQGFARTRPLREPERTDEDEMLNRRVEIRVLSK